VSSRRSYLVALAVLAGVLALHAWRYFPFFSDEALVALRYAKRLASGDGLTFSDGERVEGYTSFLWVLLNGIVALFGFGLIPVARALGFGGVLVCVACVGLDPRRRGVFVPRLVAGGVLLVATAPLAIGSIGGLEQGLLAGVLGLSLRFLERSAFDADSRPPWQVGIPLALVALLRLDGLLLVLALVAGAACLPRPSLHSARRAVLTLIPCALAVLAELVFRLSYYGDWLPHSLRTRVSEPVARGLAYAGAGYSSASMLVLLALVATVFALRRGERWGVVMPWALVVGSTASVALVGGDVAPGFRLLVPALVALCFLVADEVAAEWSRVRSQRLLILPILALCVFLHATQSADTAENRRAKGELGILDELAVGLTLKTAFGPRSPLFAVDQPGALPFASELPTLDLTGVNTPGLADGFPLHRHLPDLVAFRELSKPATPAGNRLFRTKDFAESYQSTRVKSFRGVEREFWVRREGGRLGVVRSADRIDVPGYFFTGQASKAAAALDRSGVLVAELSPREPGVLPELTVPAGRYRLDVSPSAAELVADFRCQGVSMQRNAQGSERVFEIDRATHLDIALAPQAGTRGIELRSITLTRVAEAPAASGCTRTGTPLRVAAGRLASEMPPRAHWAHPKNFMFASDGVVIEMGSRPSVAHVEVSLSRNDAYLLELRRDGHVVWHTNVERERSGRSHPLVLHGFDLPKPIDGGRFELFVKPRKGTAPSSIGHLTLQ
jgi:arabinofuranosyltransferase